jgi:hypothetical protein
MDVTNPGLVSVEDETYGDPDPNGGTATWQPRQAGVLQDVADESYPRPSGDVLSSVFPTPADVVVRGDPPVGNVLSSPVPAAASVDVASQDLGHGTWVPVDPLDPAAGKRFVSPAEFVVVGPAESFQTNASEVVLVTVTVAAVYDADNLYNPPGPSTTRYMLVTVPPSLTSYPVSLLGRDLEFAEDTATVANRGAVRPITNYSGNFVVVDRDDPNVANGTVAQLATPAAGDTFVVDVRRSGSEQVNTERP